MARASSPREPRAPLRAFFARPGPEPSDLSGVGAQAPGCGVQRLLGSRAARLLVAWRGGGPARRGYASLGHFFSQQALLFPNSFSESVDVAGWEVARGQVGWVDR